MAGDPVRHGADDLGLPSLALRIGIARIVVDGEAMLGTVDFDELVLSCKLLGRPAGRFHRDEVSSVPCTMSVGTWMSPSMVCGRR